MNSNEIDTTVETHEDVCVSAIAGGVLGCLSVLAVLSKYFWFLPILTVGVLAYAAFRVWINRAPMFGTRFGFFGFCLALTFGTAGFMADYTYKNMQELAGRHFAQQCVQLLAEGRTMEAIQLQKASIQRYRGLGILDNCTRPGEGADNYRNFMQSPALKILMRDFQPNPDFRFIRKARELQMKHSKTYFFVYEFAIGEGMMRKTREFTVRVTTQKVVSDPRFDWTFQGITPISQEAAH